MKISKHTAGAVLFTICIFLLFFHFFTFESKTRSFSNINFTTQPLGSVKLHYLGQQFRVDSDFNTIGLTLFNPLDHPVNCTFALRKKRDGKIIYQQSFSLKPQTSIAHIKEFPISDRQIKPGSIYYFEVTSIKEKFSIPFHKKNHLGEYFKTYTGKGQSRGVALFSLDLHQEMSILSYLLDKNSHHRYIILLLMLLSVFALYFAARHFTGIAPQNANPHGNRQHSRVIVTLLYLSMFLVFIILIGILVGNNTHARLLGAEDDAFITYKYSQNIAQGNGFRFNNDEKVLGTTTPLYTLLLALWGLFSSNIHTGSFVINIISIILSGIIVYLLLSRYLSSQISLAGGLLFIFFPMFYRVMGMETNFLIFLVLLGLYFLSRDKHLFTFIIIGLAVMTRIEALLLVPLLGIWFLYNKKFALMLKCLGVFILTILPWFIFSYLYFGNLLPNTFYIKTSAGSASGSTIGNLLQLIPGIFKLEFMKSMFFKGFGSYLQQHFQHYILWMILFGISLPFAFKYLLKIKEIRFMFLWALGYVLAFSVLHAPLFIWYYVLALAIIPIIVILGIDYLMKLARPVFKEKITSLVSLCLIFLVLIFAGRGVFNIFYSHWYSRNMFYIERYETYRDIASYIETKVPAQSSVAMEEIGVVAYYSPNKIWDFYSLVHKAGRFPHNLNWQKSETIPYLLTLMDADYIVLNAFRYNSHTFYKNYQLEKTFPVHQYFSTAHFYYLLLSRKPEQAIVLGKAQLPRRISGTQNISGWAFGSEPIDSIEITVGDQIIQRIDVLEESSSIFKKKYRYNPYSGRAMFNCQIDTNQFINGHHTFRFQAIIGNKRGIFQEARTLIKNK